jgi:hypothetical protein
MVSRQPASERLVSLSQGLSPELSDVLARIEAALDDIAAEVFGEVWGVPGYDEEHLPPSDLVGFLGPNLRAIVRSLRSGGQPEGDALAAARRIGEVRALQGVPIDAVIQSWSTAERVLREHLLQFADRLTTGDLRDCVHRLAMLFVALTRASVDAYRTTQDEVTAHYDRLTTDLLSRLTGEQPADPDEIRRRARTIGVDPSAGYAAVTIAVAGADRSPEPHAYLRIQRHLLATVGARVTGRVLVGTMDEFPLLLVPAEGGTEALEAQLRAALDHLPGPEAVIAGVGAEVAALPAAGPACRQARDALEIGRRLAIDDPVVRFADVAADVLLLRNPDVAALLAGRLAPLATRPELLQTLRTYLECGMSARETARRLYLHPNTVPYRLKVVEQCLGRELSTVAADPVTVLGLRALAMGAAP